MTKIGPKETALKSKRAEIAEGIPDFLKRTETPEQEAKRRKRDAKRPDMTGGLKVIEPMDPKIRKAIEKDLRDDPVIEAKAELVQAIDDRLGELASPTTKKSVAPFADAGDLQAVSKPKKEKKLPRVLQKALAEKEKLNQPKHDAEATKPMETTMKKSVKKVAKATTKKTTAKKAKGAARKNGSYDWTAAEALAKAGKIPSLPSFRSYASQFEQMRAFALKKDLAGIKKFSAEFKDEKGARANLFRFRDLCVTALKA
jgi:hypothetical protein